MQTSQNFINYLRLFHVPTPVIPYVFHQIVLKSQDPTKIYYYKRYCCCYYYHTWCLFYRPIFLKSLRISPGSWNVSKARPLIIVIKISPVGDWRSTSLEWPWPSPWFRPYGIPSCITHRPLPTYQLSLRWEENFFWKSPLRFWSSSESRDTKTRTNIKNPARSNLDIVP